MVLLILLPGTRKVPRRQSTPQHFQLLLEFQSKQVLATLLLQSECAQTGGATTAPAPLPACALWGPVRQAVLFLVWMIWCQEHWG